MIGVFCFFSFLISISSFCFQFPYHFHFHIPSQPCQKLLLARFYTWEVETHGKWFSTSRFYYFFMVATYHHHRSYTHCWYWTKQWMGLCILQTVQLFLLMPHVSLSCSMVLFVFTMCMVTMVTMGCNAHLVQKVSWELCQGLLRGCSVCPEGVDGPEWYRSCSIACFFFPGREYVHVYIRNALQSPLSWAIHPLLRYTLTTTHAGLLLHFCIL